MQGNRDVSTYLYCFINVFVVVALFTLQNLVGMATIEPILNTGVGRQSERTQGGGEIAQSINFTGIEAFLLGYFMGRSFRQSFLKSFFFYFFPIA